MKKRYQVTLTEETVVRFQSIIEKMKMPKGVMSTVLDESLLSVTESMEKFVSKSGKLTIGDLFTAIGEQLDKITEEGHAKDGGQEKPAKKRQEKKTA